MKKNLLSIFYVATIFTVFLNSCSNSASGGSNSFSYSEKVNEKFTSAEIQGTWKGILKGADCTCIINGNTCTIYANYKNSNMTFNYTINNSMAIHEKLTIIDPNSSNYEISSNICPMIIYFEKIGDKAILTPVMKKDFFTGNNSSHLGFWNYVGNDYEGCYITKNTVTAHTFSKNIEMPYSIIGNGFEENTKRAKWYDNMNSKKWRYNDFRVTTGGIILTYLEEPSIFSKID